MLKYKLLFYIPGFFLIFFATTSAQAYTLSTGAKVDNTNLSSPRQRGNGAAAEKWCAEEGKRLPTLAELKEMYDKREIIGGFTDGCDPGGWPYWAERVTNNPDGKNFGNRIIFGNGNFGEQGEVQYLPFWIHSGVGAYVRCVSKMPEEQNVQANTAESTQKNKTLAGLTLEELLEMYKNNELTGVVLNCDKAKSYSAKKRCLEKFPEASEISY